MEAVFLDIETASRPEWLWQEALKHEKDPERVRAWLRENANAGALSPWTGWACCWALAAGEISVWSHAGTDERTGLLELLDLLLELRPFTIVAHNGHAFDFPFLRVRALAQGLPELAALLYQDKPWSGRLVDTADPSWVPRPPGARKGWLYNLDDVADLLGITRPPTIPGSTVPLAAIEGRFDEIRDHCIDDVRTLRQVYPLLAAGRRRA